MRDPIAVALEIKEVLPEDKKEHMDWCVEDFSYKAPEQIGFCFRRLYEVMLNNDILAPILTEEWQFKVASIFSTLSVEECKKINAEEKVKLNGK
jgi:hypothetical protein